MKKHTFKAQLAHVINAHQHGPFTCTRLQLVQVLTAHILLAFLLLQCSTYKKQVENDAGQEKIKTGQKDVASGQTMQKTMAQKGRRVNLPLLPDSLTKDIYITDSMQALYDDEEWVVNKIAEQLKSKPEAFEKFDTVLPLFQKVFPGVDIYFSKTPFSSGKGNLNLEYRGHAYTEGEMNILFALTEREHEVTVEERLACAVQFAYFDARSVEIKSVEKTDTIINKEEYQYRIKGEIDYIGYDHWGGITTYKGPFEEFVIFKNNQIVYIRSKGGSGTSFWYQESDIRYLFILYSINKFYNLN